MALYTDEGVAGIVGEVKFQDNQNIIDGALIFQIVYNVIIIHIRYYIISISYFSAI